MLSIDHQILVTPFENRPTLAAELVRATGTVDVPLFPSTRIGSTDLTESIPAQYRADLVVEHRDEADASVVAFAVEVLLEIAPRKKFTLPQYAIGVRSRLECPTFALVVTPFAHVARWAREPIRLGGASVFVPVVLWWADVPVVQNEIDARASPELAVLSTMAHGRGPDGEAVARSAIAASKDLDEERAELYLDLILHNVTPALGDLLKKELAAMHYPGFPRSDYFKELIAERVAEGEAAGIAKGEAAGIAKGEAAAILTVLEARGLTPTEAERARILACTDVTMLKAWLRRAATVGVAVDVFVDS